MSETVEKILACVSTRELAKEIEKRGHSIYSTYPTRAQEKIKETVNNWLEELLATNQETDSIHYNIIISKIRKELGIKV